MTAPVTVKILPGAGPNCESTFIVSFYVGQNHKDNPPKPTNPDVYIDHLPEMNLYARYAFLNFTQYVTAVSPAYSSPYKHGTGATPWCQQMAMC